MSKGLFLPYRQFPLRSIFTNKNLLFLQITLANLFFFHSFSYIFVIHSFLFSVLTPSLMHSFFLLPSKSAAFLFLFHFPPFSELFVWFLGQIQIIHQIVNHFMHITVYHFGNKDSHIFNFLCIPLLLYDQQKSSHFYWYQDFNHNSKVNFLWEFTFFYITHTFL